MILWFKEKDIITQGKEILAKKSHYLIDDDYSLHIRNVNLDDTGDYACKILPESVTQHTILKVISEEELMKGE